MMGTKIKENGLQEKMVGYQADAHNLVSSVKQPDPVGKFDLVFNCNLIDRLHTPLDFVTQGRSTILLGQYRRSTTLLGQYRVTKVLRDTYFVDLKMRFAP